MGFEVEVAISLAVVLLVLVLKNLKKPKNFPPGPPALPVIGSLPFVPRKILKSQEGRLEDYLADKYGDIVGFYNGSAPLVFISDLELLKTLFKTDKIADRPLLRPFNEIRFDHKDEGPSGYLFSSDQKWKDQRRFALRNLRDLGFGRTSMEGMINNELHKLVDLLKEDHEGKPTSLNLVMNISIVNALWTILVGEELSLRDPKLHDMVKKFDNVIRANTAPNLFLSSLGPTFVRYFDRFYGMQKNFLGTVLNYIKGHVEAHEENFDEDGCNDFIDIYLKEIKQTTDKNSSFYGEAGKKSLLVSLLDLFLAGTETTTSTLMWGILFMIHEPEIQQRVHDEIDKVLGADQHPTLDDEPKLPYTCAVINEIMRKSSLVPKALPHVASTNVEVNGYTIPKNAFVFSNLMRIHHDERYWKEPMKFDPGRFYDEKNNKLLSSSNLVPFGIGKRVCLGQTLAEKELFLFFVGLMQAFTFEPSPDDPLPACDYHSGTIGSTIRTAPLYKMVLKSRKSRA